MRQQERIILCGTNGTGKSTLAKKLINACIHLPDKRALAILPDDSEPIFKNYNELEYNELKYISSVANKENKIFFPIDKKQANNFFSEVQTYFKNGILALDDARFYSGANVEDGLRNVFIRSRQNNVDVLFICHGLSEIPPSLITFATKIILFNTVDSWQRLKNKIPNPSKFEKFVNEVRQKASQHKSTCDVHKRSKCSCGAAYVKKVIDVKIDLIQGSYE